ncbi:MAG: acyltransferase family protein, partial [Desemzia incerta]
MTYNKNIDIMKGISILFVVIIHSLKDDTLRSIGGPFFILQAVPVFLIISGYNHSQSYTRSGIVSLKDFYRPAMMTRKFY